MSYEPYENSFPTKSFTLSSPSFSTGESLPKDAWSSADSTGTSPELTWGGLPEGTRSILVTVFDADAPIPGGFWHWATIVPATTGGLAAGAGKPDGSTLPPASISLVNSFGVAGYVGAQPPAGTGTHRYFIAATALSSASPELPDAASLAIVQASIIPITLGRAILVATATAE